MSDLAIAAISEGKLTSGLSSRVFLGGDVGESAADDGVSGLQAPDEYS